MGTAIDPWIWGITCSGCRRMCFVRIEASPQEGNHFPCGARISIVDDKQCCGGDDLPNGASAGSSL